MGRRLRREALRFCKGRSRILTDAAMRWDARAFKFADLVAPPDPGMPRLEKPKPKPTQDKGWLPCIMCQEPSVDGIACAKHQ